MGIEYVATLKAANKSTPMVASKSLYLKVDSETMNAMAY